MGWLKFRLPPITSNEGWRSARAKKNRVLLKGDVHLAVETLNTISDNLWKHD